MHRFSLALAALSLVAVTGMAEARNGCPPGLDRQNNHCLPPGLAKKLYRDSDRRDRNRGDYIDARRYGLDPRRSYWRSGDNVFEVDRNSGEVRVVLGAIQRLLN